METIESKETGQKRKRSIFFLVILLLVVFFGASFYFKMAGDEYKSFDSIILIVWFVLIGKIIISIIKLRKFNPAENLYQKKLESEAKTSIYGKTALIAGVVAFIGTVLVWMNSFIVNQPDTSPIIVIGMFFQVVVPVGVLVARYLAFPVFLVAGLLWIYWYVVKKIYMSTKISDSTEAVQNSVPSIPSVEGDEGWQKIVSRTKLTIWSWILTPLILGYLFLLGFLIVALEQSAFSADLKENDAGLGLGLVLLLGSYTLLPATAIVIPTFLYWLKLLRAYRKDKVNISKTE